MECDAGAFFVLFLLQPSRLWREQVAEAKIAFIQSIDLAGFDAIPDEYQDRRLPFVSLRFVFADMVRQQRMVFGLFFGRPQLLTFPTVGAPLMIGNSFL